MRFSMKLYTTFDADLISLNATGISVPALIAETLYARARGQRKKYIVAGCPEYELSGRKRSIALTVIIDDQRSIDFLKREIKPRQRSAFFKAIVREALVNQAVGVYYKNQETREKEGKCAMKELIGADKDTEALYPKKKIRKAYVRLMSEETPDEPKGKENKDDLKKYGDVADLSLPYQQKIKEQRKKAGLKKEAGESPEKKKGTIKSDNKENQESDLNRAKEGQSENSIMNLFLEM